jgi:hypothetical protein
MIFNIFYIDETLKKAVVGRCLSSNPRLDGTPPSPLPAKRQTSASLCDATVLPEQNNAGGRLFQKNPNLIHKTSSAAASPVIPQKKPLARLLKSTPSTLVPPLATPTEESTPKTAGGLRAAFYRNLSRRDSTTSGGNNNIEGNNNVPPPAAKDYLRRNSSQYFQSRLGQGLYRGEVFPNHEPLSQMNSNSSSNFERRSTSKSANQSLGKMGEPLPWCGCWGNGCI